MIALALCFAQRRRRRHAANQSNSSGTGSGPKAKTRNIKAASSYMTAGGGVGAASRELRDNDKAEVLVVHNEL